MQSIGSEYFESSISIHECQGFLYHSRIEVLYDSPMEIKDIAAKWIKDARENAGLSGSELATKLTFELNGERSYTRANISHWETGRFKPNIMELVGIRKITKSYFPAEVTGINAPLTQPPIAETQLIALPFAAPIADLRMNLRRSNDANVTPLYFPVSANKFHQVGVFGQGMGGIPDRLWNDADFIAGFSDKFSEIATQDENAFIISVEGVSMVPKYTPKNYALIEPNTAPEIGDDVLVRFMGGETVLKKLGSRKNGRITLESYNDPEVIKKREEDILWMYYVAYPIPARKIKNRT